MSATLKTRVGGDGMNGFNLFTATSFPTVDNDITDGIQVGDHWINTSVTPNNIYVCVGNVDGAAIWSAISNVGSAATPIADPGNGGAIPVTTSGRVAVVTAGAGETRTLADPTFVGQELVLYVKTDGGGVAITAAHAVNQTGNTVMTMNEVRDFVKLVAIESGANKVWQVVANDGVALS